jgi:hypothetical protein
MPYPDSHKIKILRRRGWRCRTADFPRRRGGKHKKGAFQYHSFFLDESPVSNGGRRGILFLCALLCRKLNEILKNGPVWGAILDKTNVK